MKRIILFISTIIGISCLFAITISAQEMTNYCDVKITLVDGTEMVGYCAIDKGSKRLQRDNIYTTPDNSSETISWSDIKIFDARETTVVGGVDPTEIAGVNCNSLAVNTTEFYFPPTTTKILNTSFTSGWQSLQKVFIPKSVTVIDQTAFQNSPVREVVLEEGIALESIGSSCFQGCANLSEFAFPETLESIGRNGFYQSGLSGTVVVPNSVTYLAPGAFLSTKIETLVLGDGELKIGYNFAGTYNSTQNSYLKNVYINTSTTFEYNGGSKIFFKCTNPVNFYVIGENADAFVETLKSQSTGTYMTFITEDEVTESTGAGYGIIRTGYNRCDAFYGGVHDYDEITDPEQCSTSCKRCEKVIYGENHDFVIEATYEGERYLTSCEVVKYCSECSYVASTTNVGKIIHWLGYSVPETEIGDTVGISQSYYIDKAELEKYENATGEAIEYGMVAAVGTKDTPLTVVDGKAVAEQGVIAISMTNTNCFEIKLGGIKSADFDTAFVFNCYVVEKGVISYVSGDKTAKAPCALSYNQIR